MIELLAAPPADLKNARRESCVSITAVPPRVSYRIDRVIVANKLSQELVPMAEIMPNSLAQAHIDRTICACDALSKSYAETFGVKLEI